MNEPGGQDIYRQLMDNAAAIIAASAGGESTLLADLAQRQQKLTRALAENTGHPETSRTSLVALQSLVEKAMDAVRVEMGQNRGSMQATGIKKKVLRAYGTVTISNPPSR